MPKVKLAVDDALRHRTELDDLDALLAEMLDETGGPMTDDERAQIDREAAWPS